MKNMNQFLKQAQQMQLKIGALQSELGEREIDVSAQGGMVKIKINGKLEILDLSIDRECVDPDDVEILQDMIKSTVNKAIKQSQDMVNDAMLKVTGGIKLPGIF